MVPANYDRRVDVIHRKVLLIDEWWAALLQPWRTIQHVRSSSLRSLPLGDLFSCLMEAEPPATNVRPHIEPAASGGNRGLTRCNPWRCRGIIRKMPGRSGEMRSVSFRHRLGMRPESRYCPAAG